MIIGQTDADPTGPRAARVPCEALEVASVRRKGERDLQPNIRNLRRSQRSTRHERATA